MAKSIIPVIESFWKGETKKVSNTNCSEYNLFLFRHRIAWMDENKDLWITACRWRTRTTKDRLCMLGAIIQQVKGIWYLKGQIWDGNKINYTKYLEDGKI